MSGLWPPVFMNLNGYPYNCEVSAITSAAITTCDPLDGVTDGIITDPSICEFNPRSQIGKVIDCLADSGREKVKITPSAAALVQAMWDGAKHPDNSSMWYGYTQETETGGPYGTTTTDCTNGTCVPAGYNAAFDWTKLFILQDPNADLSNVTWEQWDEWWYEGQEKYSKFIETNSTDLSAFKKSGGKLLTFHGGVCRSSPPFHPQANIFLG